MFNIEHIQNLKKILQLIDIGFLTIAKIEIKTYLIKTCEKIWKLAPLLVGVSKIEKKNLLS